MLKKFKYFLMLAGMVFCFYQSASAELIAVGPANPTNQFPSWYMDENGTALELCLDSTMCVFDPVAGTAFSTTIGFGERAFYWSADATLSGSGATGGISMGLVASFSGSTTGAIPLDGEQIVFFQIAVGPITGLTAGSVYTVTHPYGVLENLVADDSGIIAIQKQDIGCASQPCDFTAVLRSALGPFLKWDTGAPVGFIGNPATAHTVIGSPFGTNIFRIDGPNAGGSGINFKQTNLFRVQGNLVTGTFPTRLIIDRATYTRPLPSAVNVSAKTAPSASVQVSGTGITTITKAADANGKFFAHIPLPGLPPDFITVTANQTTTVKTDVVDEVTITLAEYNSDLKTLTIEAFSSDQVAPGPILTAVGLGNLNTLPGVFPSKTVGRRAFTSILVPPTEITIASSAGGSETAQVTVTANIMPVARNDSALTLKNTAAVINVLANDAARSGVLDPATVTVVTSPVNGTVSVNTATGEVTYNPKLDFVGRDSFRYTVDAVIDTFNLTSNTATVSLAVFSSETLTVGRALYTSSYRWWQIGGKSTVKSGNKITVYLGPDTTGPVIGIATVNIYGRWGISRLNSPVDPGGATSVTAQSSLGTVVTFPLVTR